MKCGFKLELITFEILAAERLRLMAFDNRLIIDCFANVVNILIWQFSTNDRFKSEKYESITWKIHFHNERKNNHFVTQKDNTKRQKY